MENTENVGNVALIGEPSFGGPKKEKNWANANWAIKGEGSHIYRVLPPFASLAPSGRWFQYESVIWGFKGTNGKQRPFRSVEQKSRKGMLEVEDPAILWIKAKNDERLEIIETLKRKGKNAKEIETLTQPMTDWTSQYRVDKFFTFNVMDPNGQIGRLKVKIKQKQALEALCKKLVEDEGINPISASGGVWIDFVRTGEGRDTTYTCEAVYETVTIDGRKLKQLKTCPLTPEILKRMETEAYDLTKSFRNISLEQIQQLVNSEGDPKTVDGIFGAPTVTMSAPELPEAPEEPVNSKPDDTDSDLDALMASFKNGLK